MKIDLINDNTSINYGDVIITEENKHYIVLYNEYNYDFNYAIFDLDLNKIVECVSFDEKNETLTESVTDIVENILFEIIKTVIPHTTLKLTRV